MNDSGLVDSQGREIKRVQIPTVAYGEFLFPVHMMEEEEFAQATEQGIKPSDLIK